MRAWPACLVVFGACGFKPVLVGDDSSPAPDTPVITGAWWDPSFAYRAPIIVSATTAIDPGYAVVVNADTLALVTAGKATATGTDWRVVRHTGDAWQELDRWIDDGEGGGFDSATTSTWFRLPVPVAAGATDSDTYVYYGAPEATAPPANLDAIFVFADDFEGDLGKWTTNQRGETLAIDAQHRAGAKSLSFVTNGTEAAGMHRDITLPATQLLFSHYVRQAQTSASLGEGRGFAVPYAQRVPNFVDAQLRLSTELDSGDHLQVWGQTQLYNWYTPFNTNTWRRVETIYDGVNNRITSRCDGGAWSGPYDGAYRQGTPMVSIAVEGEGGQPGSFWLDNYVIRPYVAPEPTAQLGAEQQR